MNVEPVSRDKIQKKHPINNPPRREPQAGVKSAVIASLQRDRVVVSCQYALYQTDSRQTETLPAAVDVEGKLSPRLSPPS